MNKFFKNEQELQEFKTWLTALRSGQYQQTKHTLQNENGYCCLGVACKVVIPEDKQNLKENNFLKGAMPVAQPNAPKWLKKINSDFHRKTKFHLIYLNDIKNYTFNQIADELERIYLNE